MRGPRTRVTDLYGRRMAREPRIEVPGGFYHLGAKGNRGCVIYEDDFERRMFLTLLRTVIRRFEWTCHAFVLMSNHFHLLIKLQLGGLSDGMQLLNGGHAKFSNRRHGYVGQHLFRNRFWSDHVTSDLHLLETARYIVLNPVRAGICASPADWRWSSYRACAGFEFAPRFLAAADHLRLFNEKPVVARRAYRQFVADGIVASLPPGVRHSDELRAR